MSFRENARWRASGAPVVSVVVIGHRSSALLSRAIFSLLRHSPPDRVPWELVLVQNGDSPAVADWTAELLASERVSAASVKVSERRPGAARNAGVRVARAPLLFFLDDDIECFQDVLGAAVELFRDDRILAAGGANLTPPGSGALARATGGLMGSRFGAAGMRRRYRIGPEGAADEHGLILCNLAVRRAVFDGERGFASHLISNEENVLLQRLAARGGALFSSPRLAVFHRRRDTWRGLAKQAAKYGAGRAQNLLLLPETFRPLYLLPALFLLYLTALPAIAYGSRAAIWPLAAYFALALFGAVARAVVDRDPAQLLGAFVAPVVHLAYGAGFLRALVQWGARRGLLREQAA
jgi:glycosyltransferase involved in cell wall biosynthesis